MSDSSDMSDSTEKHHLDRRRLLAGAAMLGVAGPVLAACGSGTTSSSDAAGSAGSAGGGSGKSGGGAGGSGGSGGASLVATADVPVDGGVVIDSQKVVVTQPSQGDFKCFSAVCTHQGCLVGSVQQGTITCPCHGSQFSAEDGSVVNGPATSPLPEVKVAVKSGNVVRA